MSQNARFFICEACHFKCSKESEYNRHLATLKHEKFTKVYKSLQKNAAADNALSCECSKTYSTRMGLWKHKQKCPIVKDKNDTIMSSDLKDINSINKDDLILKLLKDNEEIRQILKDVIPKMGNNTIINNNNNTTNNFNLNVFLNEQCKDALNIYIVRIRRERRCI